MTATTTTFTRLLAWRPGGYLRASGTLFGWLALRTAAQTALFVLVARSMGAAGYGALIAVMALAGVFSFAGMGASAVLVRDGARQPERLAELTGDLLRMWLVTTPVFSALALATTLLLLGGTLPAPAMAAIVLAEVACATAVDAIGRVYQSQDRVARMGLISSGLILARLATFVALMPLLDWTPASWAWGYLASSALYLGVLVLIQTRGPQRPRRSANHLRSIASASLPFAFAYAAQKVQAEINKPMLARISNTASAGALSAAQRFTDLLLLPVLAMLETLAPRVYRAPRPIATTFTLGLIPLATAIVGGAALAMSAQWIPWLLGPSFDATASAVAILAGLPAIQSFRRLFGLLLIALDMHRFLFLLHGTGAIISIMFIAILVPPLGLKGAIYAAYSTEIALILMQIAIITKSRFRY